MSRTHLVISDQHSHPDFNNDRADLLGRLISDVRPDVLVNIGDAWDFSSLSAYDRGKASFYGRSYKKDLDAGLEFQERMWNPLKKSKKKLPYSVFCIGNHEQRIERALEITPELSGTIDYNDLDLNRYYDEVVHYNGSTPGTTEIDGVTYAHYFISGLLGRAIGGEHHASSLIAKNFTSCTCGHSHLFDFAVKSKPNGQKVMATVCGVFQDYDAPWAGESNRLWDKGVVLKREVENGTYDIQFISLSSLKKEYA